MCCVCVWVHAASVATWMLSVQISVYLLRCLFTQVKRQTNYNVSYSEINFKLSVMKKNILAQSFDLSTFTCYFRVFSLFSSLSSCKPVNYTLRGDINSPSLSLSLYSHCCFTCCKLYWITHAILAQGKRSPSSAQCGTKGTFFPGHVSPLLTFFLLPLPSFECPLSHLTPLSLFTFSWPSTTQSNHRRDKWIKWQPWSIDQRIRWPAFSGLSVSR